MGDLTSSTFPDMAKGGFQSDEQKGAFKTANHLGGGSASGVDNIEKHAEQYVMRHSTKGLGYNKTGAMRLKTNTNIGKAIGRKRGF